MKDLRFIFYKKLMSFLRFFIYKEIFRLAYIIENQYLICKAKILKSVTIHSV